MLSLQIGNSPVDVRYAGTEQNNGMSSDLQNSTQIAYDLDDLSIAIRLPAGGTDFTIFTVLDTSSYFPESNAVGT